MLRCQKVIKNMSGDNDDQKVGIKILSRVIEEPLRQIVQNAGVEPSVIVNQCAEGKGNFGYNAATGEFGDMFEMGILWTPPRSPVSPCKMPHPLPVYY